MTVTNDKKFPHAFAIKCLGGRYTPEGEKYYEEHEVELSKEYSEIIGTMDIRVKTFGNSSEIHKKYIYETD